MHLLIVEPIPSCVVQTRDGINVASDWCVLRASDYRRAAELAGHGEADAVLVPQPSREDATQSREFNQLLRVLEARRIATLILSDKPGSQRHSAGSLLETVPASISADELRGRLSMILRYHALVTGLELELHNMERLSKRLNVHFRDMDQEMRLAGRLQRDFLPDTSQPIGNLKFASVFRPASSVSGDMFDIFRIDEKHSGIYIADAVGHGMAAGLLTMFIKRAIEPKRIHANGYTVLDPSTVVASLNDALTAQSLPQCQFVTACYALIDHENLTLDYARGGHPYPILITREGVVSELKTQGGLLGLFPGEEFPTRRTALKPGDKVILHTDGVEWGFPTDNCESEAQSTLLEFLREHAGLSIQGLMAEVDRKLDGQSGSLHPPDDISLVGFEVAAN
jgi:serine phosphatase RsbU (regulator of sigma subunit)